ncbi:hypothetical protein ACFX19_034280 [Malus domestica]
MGFLAQFFSRFFSPRSNNGDQNKTRSNRTAQSQNRAFAEDFCRRFSLSEMRAATQCFSNSLRIASDDYGSVYKGTIGSDKVVAIKRFVGDSKEQFRTEVQLLCQLRHPNIISIIGFCEEKEECLIVYSYMSNGTLSKYLDDPLDRDPVLQLSWKQRLNICIGVASALQHLHTGVKRSIVHRFVNSSNILLDEQFVPKLSDFGRCMTGPRTLSNGLIRWDSVMVNGTYGYIAPEAFYGQLTEKSDVFSFGLVLLEALCGKSLPVDIYNSLKTGETSLDMIDPFLTRQIAPDCLKKFVEIIQRCVRPSGAERHSMGEVEVELESALQMQESADAVKQPFSINS